MANKKRKREQAKVKRLPRSSQRRRYKAWRAAVLRQREQERLERGAVRLPHICSMPGVQPTREQHIERLIAEARAGRPGARAELRELKAKLPDAKGMTNFWCKQFLDGDEYARDEIGESCHVLIYYLAKKVTGGRRSPKFDDVVAAGMLRVVQLYLTRP